MTKKKRVYYKAKANMITISKIYRTGLISILGVSILINNNKEVIIC